MIFLASSQALASPRCFGAWIAEKRGDNVLVLLAPALSLMDCLAPQHLQCGCDVLM